MSRNFPSYYAGITDESRVHKPPGGDTNDIFGMESRQKWQASQVYPNDREMVNQETGQRYKMMPTQEDSLFNASGDIDQFGRNTNVFHSQNVQQFQEGQQIRNERERHFLNVSQHFAQESAHKLRNIEHDIPLASCLDYARLTDKTRVRKPPGGDTNDIFDMESRQRSQAATRQTSMHPYTDGQGYNQKSTGMPNVQAQKSWPGPFAESPFFHVDKENLHSLSNTLEEDILKKNLQEAEEDSKHPSKMYSVRNPITGEVSEMKVSSSSKLIDCSNVVPNPDLVMRNPDVSKTSVRVRQPPGGVSSNIF